MLWRWLARWVWRRPPLIPINPAAFETLTGYSGTPINCWLGMKPGYVLADKPTSKDLGDGTFEVTYRFRYLGEL